MTETATPVKLKALLSWSSLAGSTRLDVGQSTVNLVLSGGSTRLDVAGLWLHLMFLG